MGTGVVCQHDFIFNLVPVDEPCAETGFKIVEADGKTESTGMSGTSFEWLGEVFVECAPLVRTIVTKTQENTQREKKQQPNNNKRGQRNHVREK